MSSQNVFSSSAMIQSVKAEGPKHKKEYLLHSLEVMKALENMRQEGTACDFIIKAGKLEFQVHRPILVACSRYFRAMFGSFMKESLEGVVELKDSNENSVRDCVKFMYTGDSSGLSTDTVTDMLHTATVLQLDRLCDLCFEFLLNNICPENCLDLFDISELYERKDLEDAASKYMQENFVQVTNETPFLLLTKDEALMLILEYASTDDMVWSASKSWIEFDVDIRGIEVLDFFNMLSLEEFPSETLINRLWLAKYFQESELCKDQLCKCLFSNTIKLSDNLSLNNWSTLNSISETYKHVVQHVHEIILRQFRLKNFTAILNHVDFCTLSKEKVIDMFKSPAAVYFSSEKLKWNAMLKWVKENPCSDSEFSKIWGTIDLRRLRKKFLLDTVSNEPLVQVYPSCKDALEAALRSPGIFLAADSAIALLSGMNDVDILDVKNLKWTPLHHTGSHYAKISTVNGHLCLLDGRDLYFFRKSQCIKQPSLSKSPSPAAKLIGLDDKIYVVDAPDCFIFDTLTNKWNESVIMPPLLTGDCMLCPLGCRGKLLLIKSSSTICVGKQDEDGIFHELTIPSDIDCQIIAKSSSAYCAGSIYASGKSRTTKYWRLARYRPMLPRNKWAEIAIPGGETAADSMSLHVFSFKRNLYVYKRFPFAFGMDPECFFKYNEEWNEWSRIMKDIPRRSLHLNEKNIKSIHSFSLIT